MTWTIEEEADRLRRRFADLKATGVGQAQFARDYSVPGGASMVSQHLSGHRPISLEAAAAYARGFRCALSEISQRLSVEVEAHAPRIQEPEQLSPSAVEIGLLYDMIPAADRIRRAQAYNAATAAIVAVLERHSTVAPAADQKKQPV